MRQQHAPLLEDNDSSSSRCLQQGDEVESYPSGARGLIFKPDGSGFVYYSSGRVAVCKAVVDRRGRYYLYGDDPKSTPLGAVNEHAVGFFLGSSGTRLALNKVKRAFLFRRYGGSTTIILKTCSYHS